MAANQKSNLRLVEEPARPTRLSMTFEAEIKRMAQEKELDMAAVMDKIAEFTGIGVSQLYNYRSGKCSIPADLIPELCRQFQSNTLAMTLLDMCNETVVEDLEGMDVPRFCSEAVRDMLECGETFMDAYADDNRIDGHELIEIENKAAKLLSRTNRLVEYGRWSRRRHFETPAPTAA